MILQPHIRRDPAEAAIARLLDSHLDKAVAASGLGETFRQGALRAMHDILLDGCHDLIEPVATVAPGTGNIVISFRISDCLNGALTCATEDCYVTHLH